MKLNNNMIALCVSVLAVLSGCDRFDDSSLWNDVDQAYNSLTEIKSQLETMQMQQKELMVAHRMGESILPRSGACETNDDESD